MRLQYHYTMIVSNFLYLCTELLMNNVAEIDMNGPKKTIEVAAAPLSVISCRSLNMKMQDG